MAYRYGENSQQMILFPQSVDEYVSQDHPVRAYDAFVDTLDLKELGFMLNDNKVGNSEYHPKLMLKLLLYGYSYGVRSSRKLERETHNNIPFIWLMRKLKPDHKTIAEFRRRNKKSFKKALKLCVQLCMELDLIDGNILFVDGTKIRANAARNKNYTNKWYKEQLHKLDERIDRLLRECETIDSEEADMGSLVKMRKDLSSAENLKQKVEQALEKFKKQGTKTKSGTERTINLTDPECALMRSVQGSHASYNVQNVVDDKNGLIVHSDTVKDTSDINQFEKQITQAEETLDKKCDTACGDAGYSDTEELRKVDQNGTKVIVPSQRQALHKSENPFSKRNFHYDKEHDCYYCPEGHKLRYVGTDNKNKKLAYRVAEANNCRECKNYDVCTKAKNGRKIVRLMYEEDKEKFEREYVKQESQKIYRRRKTRVEHPFGHIKRNLGITNFLLRSRDGTQAEISTASTCFNIARMITILGGVQGFIAQINKIQG